jgi:polyhydroxyalkanoate synthesis regulator phasin
MTSPLVQAFFVGRAVAEVLSERLEHTVTDALSELGKFDAEAREQMRQFTDEVIERANRASEATGAGVGVNDTATTGAEPVDTQATIDDLRAEIATLRAELQRYRTNAS